MIIDPYNQRVIRSMVFQDKDQEANFYKYWESHLQDIFLNHNPDNLSKEELAEIHWTRYQNCHWCWDNHVYKPFEKGAPPRIPFKISLNCETGFKHDIFDEEKREWIKIK